MQNSLNKLEPQRSMRAQPWQKKRWLSHAWAKYAKKDVKDSQWLLVRKYVKILMPETVWLNANLTLPVTTQTTPKIVHKRGPKSNAFGSPKVTCSNLVTFRSNLHLESVLHLPPFKKRRRQKRLDSGNLSEKITRKGL